MRGQHGMMHSEWDDGRDVIFSWDIVDWAQLRAYKKMGRLGYFVRYRRLEIPLGPH